MALHKEYVVCTQGCISHWLSW